jgi:hypothetical protein
LPQDRRHGIELHIDDSALEQDPPPLFKVFGIDLSQVCKKYSPAPDNLVVKAGESIEQVPAKCPAFCCFLAEVVQKLRFLNNSIASIFDKQISYLSFEGVAACAFEAIDTNTIYVTKLAMDESGEFAPGNTAPFASVAN